MLIATSYFKRLKFLFLFREFEKLKILLFPELEHSFQQKTKNNFQKLGKTFLELKKYFTTTSFDWNDDDSSFLAFFGRKRKFLKITLKIHRGRGY